MSAAHEATWSGARHGSEEVEMSLMWNPGDPRHPSTLEGDDLDAGGHLGIKSTFSLAWPFGFDGGRNTSSPSRELFVGLDTYAPGGITPEHVHPDREKVFVVLEGRARMTVGSESRTLDPGGVAFVPVNASHGFENVGDADLRIMQVIAWLESPRTA
jgi:mannose-6-phosphate isomerase-like protein (cupin superfamily)